jgi:CheY-like chemotaxis protein
VVTKHGGCVTVDSRPGDGATFHVFLPASGIVAGADRPTPLPDLPRGRERLLVMDDEHVVREVCVQILRHLGYDVDAAGWGEEAVEMYAAARKDGRPYDAVLLDLTVPGGMGGVETLAALRALDPDVRAIATSGYSDDPAIADHRRTGFAAGLAKPFSPMALGQVVRRVLGRKGPLSSGSNPKV